jgi:hypothetical protein
MDSFKNQTITHVNCFKLILADNLPTIEKSYTFFVGTKISRVIRRKERLSLMLAWRGKWSDEKTYYKK